MPNIIQLRRDTSANWSFKNPVLAEGEIGLDLTTGGFKVGNGTSTWSQLSYFAAGGVSDGDKGDITVTGGSWTIDSGAVTNSKVAAGIDAAKIADGSVSNTEFQYLNNLTAPIQTQLDGKQATLVSGSNIKTINNLSLVGAGNVSIQTQVADGDKGDVTVSNSGNTWTIDAKSVTYAKMQDVTDQRLIGRSAGSPGAPQEITVGSGLSLSGGVLTATGGAVVDGDKGDIVVSSFGSTWTIDSGAVSYAKVQNVTNNRILGRNDSGAGPIQEIVIGSGLSLSGGVLSAPGGGGGSTITGNLFS